MRTTSPAAVLRPWCTLLLALPLAACPPDKPGDTGETEETDADADADTNADTDADTDTDADVDCVLSDTGLPPTFSMECAAAKLVGVEESELAGAAIAGGGDVDGDGVNDILVGATGYEYSGRAFLVSGRTRGTASLEDAGVELLPQDGTSLSDNLAIVGDANSDGYADLAFGSGKGDLPFVLGPVPSSMSLADADMFLHAPGSMSYPEADDWGEDAVSAGDVDGNGNADFLVDVSTTAWIVTRFVPGTQSVEEVSDVTLALEHWLYDPCDGAPAEYTRVGGMTGVGDLDGDGTDDVAVSASNWDPFGGDSDCGWGVVWIGLGPLPAYLDMPNDTVSLQGQNDEHIGSDLSPAGDVNGDGFDDLLVSKTGGVYLVYGPVAASGDISDVGVPFVASWLRSVQGAGDLDGDGFTDIALASATTSSSFVYYFMGPITGSQTTADAQMKGLPEEGAETTGYTMATAGDLDGDGKSDLLLGAPYYLTEYTGSVYLLLGGAF